MNDFDGVKKKAKCFGCVHLERKYTPAGAVFYCAITNMAIPRAEIGKLTACHRFKKVKGVKK